MSYAMYQRALKSGKKEMQTRLNRGESPFLPVLDEVLANVEVEAEVSLGVRQVPLEQIVGTYTRGRSTSFAANFMPLLESNTEFGTKWILLCQSHVETGIRDSIKCYEYMNRYYVVEGNKRVSVLKFFKAVSINAEVTRIIPAYDPEDPEIRLYYEFLEFDRLTGVDFLWFSRERGFHRFPHACHLWQESQWTNETRKDLFSNYVRFEKAYREEFGQRFASLTVADAMLAYVEVYPYESLAEKTHDILRQEIKRLERELTIQDSEDGRKEAVMEPPEEGSSGSILQTLKGSQGRMTIGFVFDGTGNAPEKLHEEASRQACDRFGDKIRPVFFSAGTTDLHENMEARIEEWLEQENCQAVFFTSPLLRHMAASIAVRHPKLKVLNCDLSNRSANLRSYFGRMYEAQFVEGLIAGLLSRSGKIGYLADFPNAGMISCINAFAQGASMTCPDAKVYVAWSISGREQVDKVLLDPALDLIEYQQEFEKEVGRLPSGLYFTAQQEKEYRISSTYWNWTLFYEKMIRGLLNGTFKNTSTSHAKAVTYWWGLSSGIVNIEYDTKYLGRSDRLIRFMEQETISGDLDPFQGPLRDQTGKLICPEGDSLTTEQRTHMDWLLDSVVGEKPDKDAGRIHFVSR